MHKLHQHWGHDLPLSHPVHDQPQLCGQQRVHLQHGDQLSDSESQKKYRGRRGDHTLQYRPLGWTTQQEDETDIETMTLFMLDYKDVQGGCRFLEFFDPFQGKPI